MTLSSLPRRDQRGSRARCVLLTDGWPEEVASRLSRIVAPFATVTVEDNYWMPRGFAAPAEARLGAAELLLPPGQRQALTDWWLEVSARANTPNWDIASTAEIDGEEGLILVEAKAHSAELSARGHDIGNEQNLNRIRSAVEEANSALSKLNDDWHLSCDSHYQLANRFAWSWKLASLGVPVLLVYLGFLNADEMADRGKVFVDGKTWEETVRAHSAGVVPGDVWGQKVDVGGVALRAAIRAVEVPL